jgi:adenylosuccinate lyase
MGRIWTDEYRFRKWLEVELAATETLADAGLVPKAAAQAIRRKADFDLQRIYEIESEVRHDVIAFTTAVAESMKEAGHAEASRWMHYGLTSNDVVDTAQALLIRQASEIVIRDLEELRAVLKRRALEFRHTVQIGRTHGVHAEPITFGFKMASWYSETLRMRQLIESTRETVSFGKISGAVGTFAHLSPRVEEYVCRKLGLQPV